MLAKRIRFVSKYPIKQYVCGLKAGDKLRLRKTILVISELGKRTGKSHRKGEVWSVLQGTKGIVWLRQPDGCMHTWDDNRSIFKTFEKIKSAVRRVNSRKADAIAKNQDRKR